MKSIKIYTTSYCPYCKRAKDLLASLNIAFQEIDVESNTALREELSQKYNWLTVPMIVIGDQFIGGCDDLFALHRDQKLLKLLDDAV